MVKIKYEPERLKPRSEVVKDYRNKHKDQINERKRAYRLRDRENKLLSRIMI